jgi:GAF domain-containing protein
MYVAGGQFQRAGTIDEVLRTITEILLNFVGVGRFTVLAVDEERQVLFPLLREGGALDGREEIRLPGAGALREAASLGGPWKAGHPIARDETAIMHLPLSSGTRLVAVIRIENFLPQKGSFNDNDFGLLELISEQSGIAIETAWIRAHAKVVPLARRALEELTVA